MDNIRHFKARNPQSWTRAGDLRQFGIVVAKILWCQEVLMKKLTSKSVAVCGFTLLASLTLIAFSCLFATQAPEATDLSSVATEANAPAREEITLTTTHVGSDGQVLATDTRSIRTGKPRNTANDRNVNEVDSSAETDTDSVTTDEADKTEKVYTVHVEYKDYDGNVIAPPKTFEFRDSGR